MNKCVIFGAGERGCKMFGKINAEFEVAVYADNNVRLHGTYVNCCRVVPPSELPGMDLPVFICNELHWRDIAMQLSDLSVDYYICMEEGLCYRMKQGVLLPVSISKPRPYKKDNATDFTVLFVQTTPCGRTDKIAYSVKQRGIKTVSAFSYEKTKMDAAYDAQYAFWTYTDLVDFVNDSDFDIVHCSNEPDDFANVLINSNKPIVHDSHDVACLRGNAIESDRYLLEYIANTQSDGVIYSTELVKKAAFEKYGVNQENTLVVGNFPLTSFGVYRKSKLSYTDGELHIVYAGGMLAEAFPNSNYKYLRPVFERFADVGIHVHFYTQLRVDACLKLSMNSSYIHYEGNKIGTELISELSKYDVGMLTYNLDNDLVDTASTNYMNVASPNKMFEYLAAGLPIACNVKGYADFADKHNCGGFVDMSGDILSQMRDISKIKVDDDFLGRNSMTMETQAENIIGFYRRIASI